MRFKLIGLICLIMQCNLSCTQHIINKETVQTLDLHIIGKTKCERYKKRNAIIRV